MNFQVINFVFNIENNNDALENLILAPPPPPAKVLNLREKLDSSGSYQEDLSGEMWFRSFSRVSS